MEQTTTTGKILQERFGKDSLIALATTENGAPCVRNVNALYHDGAFFVLTYALSAKMRQIEQNPVVAICGEWFSAQGVACNLGWFCKVENKDIADKMKKAFSWINNGHNDFDDQNTCILKIKLTRGTLFYHGTRYDVDFEN